MGTGSVGTLKCRRVRDRVAMGGGTTNAQAAKGRSRRRSGSSIGLDVSIPAPAPPRERQRREGMMMMAGGPSATAARPCLANMDVKGRYQSSWVSNFSLGLLELQSEGLTRRRARVCTLSRLCTRGFQLAEDWGVVRVRVAWM